MRTDQMPTESLAAAAATAKALGLKATLGIVGAAVLYLVLPPVRPDGTFSKVEFALRLAVAGLFSTVLGDWFVAFLDGVLPVLKAAQHPEPFLMAIGAPGWYISRAAALWMHKRREHDIGQVVDDVRNGRSRQ